MEIYVAYKDYYWMMDFCEQLLEHCTIAVNGTTKAKFGKHEIDFKAPYPRVSMTDSIKEFTGFDITGKSEDEIRKAAISLGIEVELGQHTKNILSADLWIISPGISQKSQIFSKKKRVCT